MASINQKYEKILNNHYYVLKNSKFWFATGASIRSVLGASQSAAPGTLREAAPQQSLGHKFGDGENELHVASQIALGILQCQINGSQTFDPVWRLQCDAGSYRLLER